MKTNSICMHDILGGYIVKTTINCDDDSISVFQEIATDVEADHGLQEEAGIIHHVLTQMSRYQEDRQQNMGQKWKLPPNGQPICLFSGNVTATRTIIRDDDSEFSDEFFKNRKSKSRFAVA